MTATQPKVVTQKVAASETKSNAMLDKLINDAIKTYGSARERVQAAAVAIIEHASVYGDCRRARVLSRGVPARERNSLIGYFALYSPIGVKMGKTAAEDKSRFINPESKLYNDFNLDGAKANNWFDDPAQTNPEPKPLDTLGVFYDELDKLLKRMIARAQAEEDKNRIAPSDRVPVLAQATELRTIINTYRANHITPEQQPHLVPAEAA